MSSLVSLRLCACFSLVCSFLRTLSRLDATIYVYRCRHRTALHLQRSSHQPTSSKFSTHKTQVSVSSLRPRDQLQAQRAHLRIDAEEREHKPTTHLSKSMRRGGTTALKPTTKDKTTNRKKKKKKKRVEFQQSFGRLKMSVLLLLLASSAAALYVDLNEAGAWCFLEEVCGRVSRL